MRKTIIKASAGTGKTYSLSLEYIYYLLSDIDFRTILVITFTKKATFEIKERIYSFINQIVTNGKDSEELKNNISKLFNYQFKENDIEKLSKIYKDMLINADSIRIDTIDGFINKIFKFCIAEPVLDMQGYTMLDENSEKHQLVYDEILVNLLKNKNFKYKFKTGDKIEELQKKFIYNKLEALSAKPVISRYTEEDIVNEVTKHLVRYTKFLTKPKNLIKILENTEISTEEKYKSIISSEFNKWLTHEDIEGKKSEIKDGMPYILELAKLHNMIFELESSKLTNDFIANAKIVIEEEFKVKQKYKTLEFNDITYYTLINIFDEKLELIKDNKVTDKFLSIMDGDIKVVMIDEFQDTSILQFKLLKLLLDRVDILTCVGDEKQSIYEWRGGYKKLFEDLHISLGQGSVVKVLDTCYRSHLQIINFVNDGFSKIPRYNYDNVSSSKQKENKGYVTVKQYEKYKEYESILEDILKNRDFKETTVLLRTNSELEKMAGLLGENKIKYSLTSKASLLDVPAVKIAHSLVTYLATGDEFKKYEFLSSEKLKYDYKDIQDSIESQKEDKYIQEFLDKYTNMNSINSSIYDFGEEYIKLFGYSLDKTDVTDIVNLREYFNIMKSFVNITDFYEYISSNGHKKKSVVDKESVVLMTIHASKGLEFKTVYIFNKKKIQAGAIQPYKYITYDDGYNMEDFLISEYKHIYYYEKAIKDRKDVERANILKGALEGFDFYKILTHKMESDLSADINTKYVAYTRPKENLYIYFDESDSIVSSQLEYGTREVNEDNTLTEDEDVDYSKYAKYLSTTKYKDIASNKKMEDLGRRLIGKAVHYFFEVYDKDIKVAKDIMKKRYGNLLNDEEMLEVLDFIDTSIEKYKDIFDNDFERYPEFSVSDKEGNNFKIDLVMLDRDNKKAYVYDYKTGENAEINKKYIEQVEHYKNLLKEILPDFTIEGKILQLYH